MNKEEKSKLYGNGTLCTYEPRTPGLPEQMEVCIRGIATIEQPVIGRMYIVEVCDNSLPNDTYPYKYITALECNLTPKGFYVKQM